MSFKSYAQNFEDVILWRALRDAELKSYLDIGAQDPTLDSVSLAFYEAGWRGTHVEPTPFYATKLREARPDEAVIEAAVSTSPGPIELYEFPDTGLSTGKSKIAQMHQEHGFPSRTILVPTIRLDNLLERTGEVSWMKIDVEGMEADVLESWGDCPIRPWILVIEATVPTSQVPTDLHWRDQVLSRGYKEVYFDGLSRYFVSEKQSQLAEVFTSPPNIFDEFNVAYHHFSARDLVGLLEEHMRDSAATLAQRETELEKLLLESASELAEKKIELGKQAELLNTINAIKAAQDEALKLAAVAAQEHRDAVERLQEERRELERLLRKKIETSARERQAFAEELATFRERSVHLSKEKQRIEGELQQLGRRLAEASDLIRKALAQPTDRWHRLGRALGVTREDGARQVLQSRHTNYLYSDFQPTDPAMHIAPTREVRNPYLRANSLAELLSWHDVDFVRCAYVTILGRQPDANGEYHFTNRLRMGDSKYAILWQLRRSEEGPGHDPGIAGLDRALKKEALRRNRILGWLVRVFVPGEGVSRQDRRFRQLQNSLALVGQHQSRQTDAILAIQARGSTLAADVEKIAGDLDRLARHGVSIGLHGGNPSNASPLARVTDDLDLSSRERAVLSSIRSAKY